MTIAHQHGHGPVTANQGDLGRCQPLFKQPADSLVSQVVEAHMFKICALPETAERHSRVHWHLPRIRALHRGCLEPSEVFGAQEKTSAPDADSRTWCSPDDIRERSKSTCAHVREQSSPLLMPVSSASTIMCLMDGFAHRFRFTQQPFDIAIRNPPWQQLLRSPDPDCPKGFRGTSQFHSSLARRQA